MCVHDLSPTADSAIVLEGQIVENQSFEFVLRIKNSTSQLIKGTDLYKIIYTVGL